MNTKFNLFENIDINFNFNISFWTVSTITLIGIFVFYIKNPEKFEKLISLIAKFLNFLTHKFDKTYIKFDLQGKINSYVKDVKKRTKHLSVDGVKIHMLCALQDTKLAQLYYDNKIDFMSEDEYVNLAVDFLEFLPPETTIHRLAGNGLKKNLIVPRWLGAKLDCLNKIDREFIRRDSWQGSKYL